jgi:serine/threonine-protein kinase ATR
MAISWILDSCHRVVSCFLKLASFRCLDRRKVVACLSHLLFTLSRSGLVAYNCQSWLQLLIQTLSLLSASDDPQVQIHLAGSLVFALHLNNQDIESINLNASLVSVLLRTASKLDTWAKMIPDLQNAIKLYLHGIRDNEPLSSEVEALLRLSELDKVQPFVTDTLQDLYRGSTRAKRAAMSLDNEQGPPPKRQKLRVVPQDSRTNEFKKIGVEDLFELLELKPQSKIEDLQNVSQDQLAALRETDVANLLEIIKYLPCNGSESLQLKSSSKHETIRLCAICDSAPEVYQEQSSFQSYDVNFEECSVVYHVLCALTGSPVVQGSKTLRISLVQTIRRFVIHVDGQVYLNLTEDTLGRYCVKSLQSYTRELRVASSQALMSYLRSSIPDPLVYRNRSTTFELLKKLNTRDNLPLKETLIATWGKIGRLGGEEELNLALIELVDALGHPHPILYGGAYLELVQLSKALNTIPIDLISPFWRSIAPGVVKDVLTRPQKAQNLSEFLGLKGGVDELLDITLWDTVPFLVITKEHAVLQRIALARAASSVQELIMSNGRTLSSVLARTLLEYSESQRAAESLLQEIIPNIKGRFIEVVKFESIGTACEILKAATDASICDKVNSVRNFGCRTNFYRLF